jgi:peptide/nickel transport system permease protein
LAKYIATRLVSVIPTLFGISVLVFLAVRFIPGTIVDQILGADSIPTQETIDSLRAYFGIDQPIHTQYLRWIGDAVQGDLGTSWRTSQPVASMIAARLPVTIELTVAAMFVALVTGIPLGILSAMRENTRLDHVIRIASLFSLSVPIFWQAAMLILVLSLWFNWTPPAGYVGPIEEPGTNFRMMILPSIVLGTSVSATIMRMTRSSMLDVMRQDYIRTARAKGQAERVIVWAHGLKNALIPVITVAGLQVGYLLGGAVITEEVFTLPGLGRLVLGAIHQRDYPVVQGAVLFIAAMFILINLIVDVIYAYVNPTLRYD